MNPQFRGRSAGTENLGRGSERTGEVRPLLLEILLSLFLSLYLSSHLTDEVNKDYTLTLCFQCLLEKRGQKKNPFSSSPPSKLMRNSHSEPRSSCPLPPSSFLWHALHLFLNPPLVIASDHLPDSFPGLSHLEPPEEYVRCCAKG